MVSRSWRRRTQERDQVAANSPLLESAHKAGNGRRPLPVATGIARSARAPPRAPWLAEREADLLPVGYFHVVFTLPAEIADIAWQNKAVVYDLLFRAASETMMTIAADPRHLGARIGVTAVLHTWGSAMTHHPHIHMIVPGGGISLDGRRWISSRPAFLLPVRVLGALFRRLFLTRLIELHDAGKLVFFGAQADLADPRRFLRHLAPLRKKRWVVYAKAPFAGPEAVLAYLSRYTHRVAISNQRLIAYDETGVTFRYKDYRREGPERQRVMTLAPHEFIRRFLLHVLPQGFHRIRHYGLLASSTRKADIARARELLAVAPRRRAGSLSKRQNRSIGSHLVPAAAGACASSRRSNAGCSRARRPALPQQPGRRRDPARPTLTSRRNALVPATAIHHCSHLFDRRSSPGADIRSESLCGNDARKAVDTISHLGARTSSPIPTLVTSRLRSAERAVSDGISRIVPRTSQV